MRIESRVSGWRCEETSDGKMTWVSNKGRVSGHTKRNHPNATCNNRRAHKASGKGKGRNKAARDARPDNESD